MFKKEQLAIEKKILIFLGKKNFSSASLKWLPIPFAGEWGISTSFFHLASLEVRRGYVKNVAARAQELAEEVKTYLGQISGIERIEVVKGYLNLYFSTVEYAQRVLDAILEEKERFGCGKKINQQIMIEFSQPNTHKAFHVGHLRSAILGDALCRVFQFAGYDVIRANYPGDMGLHVIKWLWNYQKNHSGEKPNRDVTRWMGELYSDAVKRLEENPELESEVRELYQRWDQRDPEVVALWKETRQWSLDGFNQIYEKLGITFDKYYFNSEFEHPGRKIVEELIQKKIANDERPEGAVVVKLDELLGNETEKFRVLVVLRSDNTALYATEDLALATQKFQDYPELAKSFYVVDVRQSLHFQQVFKTLEIADRKWANKCQHIPYELVTLPGNVVLASREGNVVLMEDLIREAVKRALAVVKENNPDLSEDQRQAVAEAVGIGAIKYPMLARENTKVVTFDWEAVLSMQGQTATYIQYAYVRTAGILRKAEIDFSQSVKPEFLLEKQEVHLINLLSQFSDCVQRAVVDFKPLEITNYAFILAKSFNDFYTQCPVLNAKEPVRNFRLRLVDACRQVIANCLGLMGITAPKVM
jgi:arginyl-tRNA synthetase